MSDWSEYSEGADLQNAYNYLLDRYNNQIPAAIDNLEDLANRSISG